MSNTEEFDMSPDLISLLDDEGNEYEFEILYELDYKDGHYYALSPLFELPDEDDSENVYLIFEAVESEDGEPELAQVEDDALLEEIAAKFEELFDGEFPDDDEE